MKKKIILPCILSLGMLASCGAPAQEAETHTEKETVTKNSWEAEQPVFVSAEKDPQEYIFSEDYSNDMEERYKKLEQSAVYKEQIRNFALKTLPLLHQETEESTVVSPLNLYLALSMLGECANGESRELLFNLLDTDSIEELRTISDLYWKAHQQLTPTVTEMVNNSLWLSDLYNFKSTLPEIMNSDYHASVYRGEMGSQKFNDQFHDWLNEKTNNLLKEQADAQQLSPETSAALVSALYLKAAWAEKFSADLTDQGTFTTPKGGIETEMMHSRLYGDVFKTDSWSAHGLPLSDLGTLWLYLPEEGTSLQDILSDPKAYELAQSEETDLDRLRGEVVLSVPKLDLKSGRSIADDLKSLGLGSLFTASADFSNLCEETGMCVSDIYHAAGLKTDEEGLEAAAFTVISMKTTGIITEMDEIEFTCDRPFVFILTGDDGSVLMSGTVYQPIQK